MKNTFNFRDTLINENVSLRAALISLDRSGHQILLIVDDSERLCGILTDGDIRRYILEKQSLSAPIKEIMNKNFIALAEEETSKAVEILKINRFSHLPIIDSKGKVVDLVTSIDLYKSRTKYKNIPIVINAGGKGERLLPLTKIIPKPLMPVGDKTMMESIIDNFYSYGFNKFFIIINYKKELIRSYFNENEHTEKMTFVEEDQYLGTAGGLSLVREHIDSTFFVSNCDIIAKLNYENMIDWHFQHSADLTVLGIKKKFDIPYGVIHVDKNNYVSEIKEKPVFNFFVVCGIYIMEPGILENIPQNTTFGMDQLIRASIANGKKVTCYPIEDGWFDMGQFDEYKMLLKHFGEINV